MNTTILYASTHHRNTAQLLNAIAQRYPVTLTDLTAATPRLEEADAVGFASGIYRGDVHPSLYAAAEAHAAELAGKCVFLLYTSGSGSAKYGNHFRAFLQARGVSLADTYHCRGYDTFGPFRLIGGIAKGHPTPDELAGAVTFFERTIAPGDGR